MSACYRERVCRVLLARTGGVAMGDGLTASAEAVERLRRTLISGGDIPGASRNLRNHNLLFFAALTSAVFKARYGTGSGGDLLAFIARVARACEKSGVVPAGQGKAYVQAAVDPATADLSRLDGAAIVATQLALSVALFSEWQPTADEVAAPFAKAAEDEASLASMWRSSPLAQMGEQMGELLADIEASPSGPTPEMLARAEASGGLLADMGDGLPENFDQVIELVMPDLQRAPASMVNDIARLRHTQGRSAEAIAAYQQVIASGDGELVARAAIDLGNLHFKLGDTAAARAAFQAAIDHPHPDYTPHAACALGELLSQLADTSGAQQAWQLAEDSAHPKWSAVAAGELGLLLARQGQLDAARPHLQRAIESGHPDAAPCAALNLGLFLAQAGDTAGAQAALRIAARSGKPQYGREARRRLRSLPKPRLSGTVNNS